MTLSRSLLSTVCIAKGSALYSNTSTQACTAQMPERGVMHKGVFGPCPFASHVSHSRSGCSVSLCRVEAFSCNNNVGAMNKGM